MPDWKFNGINEGYGSESWILKCEKCGRVLAEETRANISKKLEFVDECDHYYWEQWGNAGYDKAKPEDFPEGFTGFVIRAGTSVYLLCSKD